MEYNVAQVDRGASELSREQGLSLSMQKTRTQNAVTAARHCKSESRYTADVSKRRHASLPWKVRLRQSSFAWGPRTDATSTPITQTKPDTACLRARSGSNLLTSELETANPGRNYGDSNCLRADGTPTQGPQLIAWVIFHFDVQCVNTQLSTAINWHRQGAWIFLRRVAVSLLRCGDCYRWCSKDLNSQKTHGSPNTLRTFVT